MRKVVLIAKYNKTGSCKAMPIAFTTLNGEKTPLHSQVNIRLDSALFSFLSLIFRNSEVTGVFVQVEFVFAFEVAFELSKYDES